MENSVIDYTNLTKVQLVSLCKEKGIKGHSQIGITKDKIIKLLKGEIKYNDQRKKSNWSNKRKESFEKILKARRLKNNLFDYLMKNNSELINKYAGNTDDLKVISYGTMTQYKWKCSNYSKCFGIINARPRDIFRNDSKSPTQYCNKCTHKEKGITYQKNMLEKNGSIQTKIPDIINVWCENNEYNPSALTDYSHKTVTLKCPNKSAKHPDYEIKVYNIQESNCISCPKCSLKTSKAEMIIYSELKYLFKDVKWQQKIEGKEADIIIEDIKLVIEVDGFPWHRDKTEKDLQKNSIFEKNGYNVLRVRDIKLAEIKCNSIVCDLSELLITDFNRIIKWINDTYKIQIQINSEFKNLDYYKEIQTNVLVVEFKESIEHLFPESKELWDYEKNYPFVPSQFTKGSHMEVWVKCKSGHTYKRPIKQLFRTIKNKNHIMNCPECHKPQSNKRMIKINDISYNSITDCCRKLNINRKIVYRTMKKSELDNTIIENIQKCIEEILNKTDV